MTKGMRNTKRSVSMTIDRSIEEPCEVTSLTHGFEAERRGRPLRLGSAFRNVNGNSWHMNGLQTVMHSTEKERTS
jgi:hypothetical protein